MLFWNQYIDDDCQRSRITVSPLRAETERLKDFPDTMMLNGEADVLRDEGVAFARKLRNAGVDVTAIRFQGMIDLMKKRVKLSVAIAALIICYIILNVIDICSFSTKDQKCKADVAIILGAATYDGTVSPVYQERISHGIALYNEGYVKKLIVTGGVGDGNSASDAYAAKQYAISQGIAEVDILIEDTSTITQENLTNAKEIMDQNGYDTAIIVSDPLHMRRSMLLAKDAGIIAYSSPTPTSKYTGLKTQIPFLARETFFYIGYKWYRIFG